MLTRRNKRVQKDALNLKSIVVAMDQAIYAKVMEISLKHQELFEHLVLRLGDILCYWCAFDCYWSAF